MQCAFSLPTKADKVPTGADWIHEIKYDGYRMMLIREQDRVRLISRGGLDFWAKYFPLIVAAALKLPEKQFVIDGEVVVLDKEGKSDFDALASRTGNALRFRLACQRWRRPTSAAALHAQGCPRSTAL
jgi:bifunctional non-homologous end joining protein LigD